MTPDAMGSTRNLFTVSFDFKVKNDYKTNDPPIEGNIALTLTRVSIKYRYVVENEICRNMQLLHQTSPEFV
jgi:hypothetical protein